MSGRASLKIGILLGDDIGPEVVPECVKVMQAAAAQERLEIEWRPLPIGKRGHEEHGHTLPSVTEQGLRELRWVDHGTDRACRLSPGRCHLGHAAGAQTIRSFRRGAAVALPCRHSLHPQERGHRIPARAHGGNALFRDGRRRPPRIPPQRRHHGRNAGDHPQRVEPRRARGVRDRPHPSAKEGHGRAQGARLSARLRHVRGGMPQGGARLSRRGIRGDDDRTPSP